MKKNRAPAAGTQQRPEQSTRPGTVLQETDVGGDDVVLRHRQHEFQLNGRRQLQQPSHSLDEADDDAGFADGAATGDDVTTVAVRPLANNLRVNNIVFQMGANSVGSGQKSCKICETPKTVLDYVASISAAWKQQANALSLTPVKTVAFLRRSLENLHTMLSIDLFDKTPDDTEDDAVAATGPAIAEQEEVAAVVGGVEEARPRPACQKRKRTATASNDCEHIFFEKDGRFVYRRVESAEKYAKRSKPAIERYICIVPKSDEDRETTRNCVAKQLRLDDAKFLSGNEVKFSGSYEALYRELAERMDRTTLDRFAAVRFVDAGDSVQGKDDDAAAAAAAADDDDDDDERQEPQPPPVKTARREENESRPRAAAAAAAAARTVKRTSKRNGAATVKTDAVHRTGVEDYTEESDSSESESENAPGRQRTATDKSVTTSEKVAEADVSGHVAAATAKTVEAETAAAVRAIQNLTAPLDVSDLDAPPSPFLQTPPAKSRTKKKHRDRGGGGGGGCVEERSLSSKNQPKNNRSDLDMEIEDYCNSIYA